MVARTLPGLGLEGFWNLGEDGWKAGMDSNLRKLSALTHLKIASRVSTLPGTPTDGDIYVLTTGAEENSVAVRDNGAWVYFSPFPGLRAWDSTYGYYIHFNGETWVEESVGGGASGLIYEADIEGGATLDLLGLFEAGNDYRIVLSGIAPTVASTPRLRLSANNGSSWLAGSAYRYESIVLVDQSTSPGDDHNSITATSFELTSTPSNTGVPGRANLEVKLFNPVETGLTTIEWSLTCVTSANLGVRTIGGGWYGSSGIHDAARLYWGSGNFAATGHIKVFEEPVT